MGGRKWTNEEIEMLEDGYKNNISMRELSKKMNRSESSLTHKAVSLGFTKKYIKPNNVNYKAIYQDYDWCYERYINRGMTHEEMASEADASLRVIQKWCAEIHGLHGHSFKEFKKLNDTQYQIILFGTLGDGHIDKRPDEPLYIECHCESEKEYLFWKYSYLKDLCNQPPVYYKESYRSFGKDRDYLCQPFYRLGTRVIYDLKRIREMSRCDKISQLNEFGFCLHILDDGSRDDLWQNCLAEWSYDEIDLYVNICKERFNLECTRDKSDNRYVTFDAFSSKKIDEMILRNIPNELDIVHKKILNNDKIRKFQHSIIIRLDNGSQIGLAQYCKDNHINTHYAKLRDILRKEEKYKINEQDLLVLCHNEVA